MSLLSTIVFTVAAWALVAIAESLVEIARMKIEERNEIKERLKATPPAEYPSYDIVYSMELEQELPKWNYNYVIRDNETSGWLVGAPKLSRMEKNVLVIQRFTHGKWHPELYEHRTK